jgi:hypothetical protein
LLRHLEICASFLQQTLILLDREIHLYAQHELRLTRCALKCLLASWQQLHSGVVPASFLRSCQPSDVSVPLSAGRLSRDSAIVGGMVAMLHPSAPRSVPLSAPYADPHPFHCLAALVCGAPAPRARPRARFKHVLQLHSEPHSFSLFISNTCDALNQA